MRMVFLSFLVFFLAPSFVHAQVGTVQEFFVDSFFDKLDREEMSAELVRVTPQIVYYADLMWWGGLQPSQRADFLNRFESLSREFQNKIYPSITSAFGSEWRPGVDGDERLYVLIHPMRKGAGGYMRTADEYLKVQFPSSNEHEMVYLSVDAVSSELASSFLVHEFIHLVTFHEKDKKQRIVEDVWLNEARAEYAPTFLGYSESFNASVLKQRADAFLLNPSDALLEWDSKRADYASVSMFAHYLVDNYGVGILQDSLRSDKIGIESLNETLKKNGFQKPMEDIFVDWAITLFVNDCGNEARGYCYFNKNLESFRISPNVNFLPRSGASSLSISKLTPAWAGNWEKIVGGSGTLKFEFNGTRGVSYRVPLIIETQAGGYKVEFLELDQNNKGAFTLEDFGTQNRSLVVLPLVLERSRVQGITYPYSFTASVVNDSSNTDGSLGNSGGNGSSLTETQIQSILSLLAAFGADSFTISNVEAALQGNPVSVSPGQSTGKGISSIPVGFRFDQNLQLGARGEDVRYLQMFLNANPNTRIASFGPGSPGNETGFFGPLTQAAVVKFQEQYASEILVPWGLSRGTGVVGPTTREKIHELLP